MSVKAGHQRPIFPKIRPCPRCHRRHPDNQACARVGKEGARAK